MPPILLEPLSAFAAAVSARLNQPLAGEPEEQLRAPLEKLLEEAGRLFGIPVICQGEFHIKDIGRPDYAVNCQDALCGYVEVKRPGKGVDPARYRGHDKRQWESFKALPNILYTDGNDWALYRNGELAWPVVRLCGDIAAAGKKAACGEDATALEALLRDFLEWQPVIQKGARNLARLLAPLCRLLRREVAKFLQEGNTDFSLLYSEWRETLFPGQSMEDFADAYAQTVTFSLLLANAEGGNVQILREAEAALAKSHLLLASALKIFTDNLRASYYPIALAVQQRIIAAIPPGGASSRERDPWLYFYEDFLAEYDPELRKKSGSYYTPVEVVQAMTRLAAEILKTRMGKTQGFAAPDVLTLDPATGTGTFLLGIIAETLAPVAQNLGPGAVAAYAEALARQLYGFELQVGPYAVAQLRLTRALQEYGASLPGDGVRLYLTDTLESPYGGTRYLSLLALALSEQHEKVARIKQSSPILVCIGNPPYHRHAAASAASRKESGGWVRWGDEDADGHYQPESALLSSFARPVINAGQGQQLANLYNLYVYFWRWALWKVFEQKLDTPGIVAFITASSFLEGPAFMGMRQALRGLCDDVWIIDLGGEGRGSRREENIFSIQTPVCITLAARYGKKEKDLPAAIHYTRIAGSGAEKLAGLGNITGFGSLDWQAASTGWQASFMPSGNGDYFSFPRLQDIFPWQQSGIKGGRTWIIGSDKELLERRWQSLFKNDNPEKKRELFKDSLPTAGGRAILDSPKGLFSEIRLEAMGNPGKREYEKIVPYGFRSFDRQYLLADARCLDRPRPSLWNSHSERQIYFATKFGQAVGKGPALTLSSAVPDMDYFCKRGAKDIMPLYRDAAAREANILPGLPEFLSRIYGEVVGAEDVAAYAYAILGQGFFTEKFQAELTSREIRLPLTKSGELFFRAAEIGRRLIWLHSYGERMIPEGARQGAIPPGKARCVKAVPGDAANYPNDFSHNEATGTLVVGDGEFAPVSTEIYNFEVSGLRVVQSWLNYRMRENYSRKSSPLDGIRPESWTLEYTEGLLRLLWILEATLASWPAQRELLEEILAGELLTSEELPEAPLEARSAPGVKKGDGQKKLL